MGFLQIFKPAYKSKDPEVRLKAIEKIDDENLLARLAMDDPSPRVRSAAVRKVGNQDLLQEIALDGKEIDARIAAVERIDDQEMLAEIIKIRKNYQLTGACFTRITDRKILEKIAHDPGYNMSARRLAIEQFADEAYLAEMKEEISSHKKGKSQEEIDAIISKYGSERLVHALGKFRGSVSAVKALGEVMRRGGDAAQAAVEQLTKSLLHASPEIHREAEKQLAAITDPDLIALLISMIDNKELHEKILTILQKIDHKDAKEIVKKYQRK